MDPEMEKLKTDVAGLKERVAALELADKEMQAKAARDVADALAAAKPQKQDFWKKKEAPTGNK